VHSFRSPERLFRLISKIIASGIRSSLMPELNFLLPILNLFLHRISCRNRFSSMPCVLALRDMPLSHIQVETSRAVRALLFKIFFLGWLLRLHIWLLGLPLRLVVAVSYLRLLFCLYNNLRLVFLNFNSCLRNRSTLWDYCVGLDGLYTFVIL